MLMHPHCIYLLDLARLFFNCFCVLNGIHVPFKSQSKAPWLYKVDLSAWKKRVPVAKPDL